MNSPDLDEAKAMHRAGLLPLRAAVWVLLRYREQIPGRTATAEEVAREFECHRTSAFRALREIRSFQMAANEATHKPVAESATPLQTSSRIGYSATDPVAKSATPSSEIGYSPTPPYKDRELGKCAAAAHAREESIPNGPSPEAERREVVRFVGDVTAGALDTWASSACRVYPAAWVRALAERRCVGVQPPRAQYLNAILQAWARSGSCEYLEAPTVPFRSTGTASGSPSAPIPYQSAADRRRAAMRADVESWEIPD